MTHNEELSKAITQAFRKYNLKRHWILNNTAADVDKDELLERLVANYNKHIEMLMETYDEYINDGGDDYGIYRSW